MLFIKLQELFNNYNRLAEFKDKLLPDQHQQFQALVEERRLIAKVGLQATVDMANTFFHSLATAVIMSWDSWLQSSGFPREVQNTAKDFLFDKHKLFHKKIDESLYSLKDSRPYYCPLVCIPRS